MISYDKQEIKNQITIEQIYELLTEWQAEPEYTSTGLISKTICHNHPANESVSRKLYYYINEGSGLFHCYTGGCPESSFDIFELTRKVFSIQKHIEIDLNEAIRYVATRLGIFINYQPEDEVYKTKDWELLDRYAQIKNYKLKENAVQLKEYNDTILDHLNYNVRLAPWLNEGISQEVLTQSKIGFYPGGDQITIPHFDKDGRFIGLRGRTLCKEEGEIYGKYRPIKIGKQLYNHPLGFNLYGLNDSFENIKMAKTAIVVEGEKSVLKSKTYFGIENNICVAACGSNLTVYQAELLLDLGVNEIIIAFDKQYQQIGDAEYTTWINKLKKIAANFSNRCNISFIFDTENKLGYKDSPYDRGKDTFLYLLQNRLDKDGKKIR